MSGSSSAWLGVHSLLHQMEGQQAADAEGATFSSIRRLTWEGKSKSESLVFIRKSLSWVLSCTKKITMPIGGAQESELLTIHRSDLDGS